MTNNAIEQHTTTKLIGTFELFTSGIFHLMSFGGNSVDCEKLKS